MPPLRTALVALLLLVPLAAAVGPPPPPRRPLTKDQQARLAALDQRRDKAVWYGRMADALRLSQEIESLHRQWHGPNHWRTVNARDAVRFRLELSRLDPKRQILVGSAELRGAYAGRLADAGKFAEAEKALRDGIALARKALGDDHSFIATCYNALGMCLSDRGRHAEALGVFQTALAISRKADGEAAPSTAMILNNIAGSLNALGRQAQSRPLHEKVLDTLRRARGEDHPDTAMAYGNLASRLRALGQARRALPLFERAVAIYHRTKGEEDFTTLEMTNNLALCLHDLALFARSQALHEKILAIRRRTLGDEHFSVATSYDNLGNCLSAQGRHAEAQGLYEKALALELKIFGETHPRVSMTRNNLGHCLDSQGRSALAQVQYERALAITLKLFGEAHPGNAITYGNLAACLRSQGRLAQALPLYEKSVTLFEKTRGESHPNTGRSYSNLAYCLDDLGKQAQARALFEKALTILRATLGEGHPDTAAAYGNLADCLLTQGEDVPARDLFEKALALRRTVQGDLNIDTAQAHLRLAARFRRLGFPGHARPHAERALLICRRLRGEAAPATARAYLVLAETLHASGERARGLRLGERALAIERRALGERHLRVAGTANALAILYTERDDHARAQPLLELALASHRAGYGEHHPHTHTSTSNLALCLLEQGRAEEALRLWRAIAHTLDSERLGRAERGFDRARVGKRQITAREGLALVHAALNQPRGAWAYAEANLARNLLDDLAGVMPESAALTSHVRQLDDRLVPLFALAAPTDDQKGLRERLAEQRRAALARLDAAIASRSAELVWSLARVQKHLPADAAVVYWVGGRSENWACVVRAQGPPRWRRLDGPGAGGRWRPDDYGGPSRLAKALADPTSSPQRRRELTDELRRLWFLPLEGSLKAAGKLPAVKRLFIVPSRFLGSVPIEVLAPRLTVSYTPSATLLAQALASPRPLRPAPALVVGDPVFALAPPAAPPKYGVLIGRVLPNGGAARAGLHEGDVLLSYAGTKLEAFADLSAALKKAAKGEAAYWREGKEATVTLTMPEGALYDSRPAGVAVRAWRERFAPPVRTTSYAPLPGTRAEALALQRLLGKECRTLLGSAASEQALDGMRKEMKAYRVLHLATHGTIDPWFPERSALILARDTLPPPSENARRAATGRRPYVGELTVGTIVGDWRLDADLVVLSACQTGLGRETQGDGLLGFPYALMRAGARSVVLSLWKVDDTATALLMVRFYENLLGKAVGLKAAMKRAEALAEAKTWLRTLPRQDAEKLAGALNANKLSGTRGPVVELDIKDRPKLPTGDRPYEHPFYWAAFVLIGDPD